MDDIFEQMLAVPSWGESYVNTSESFGSLQKPFSSAQMLSSSASFDTSVMMHGPAFETFPENAQLNRLVPSLKSPPVGYENNGVLLVNHLAGAPYMPSLVSNMDNTTNATFTSSGDSGLHLGKRSRSDDENNMSVNTINGTQHHPIGDQNLLGGAASNGIKSRVRARRGQATDPHSIAERNRRERIAERMKSLQELVPDANKTDKASMLDEIINYVKFLQMQVKCLSMCRLGGSGVAGPLVADFPNEGAAANILAASFGQVGGIAGASQDGMVFAEQQVAQLMDKDMSSAMQYLQSKGLCLMPISLATAISSSSVKSKGLDPLEADKNSKEAQAIIGSSAVQSAVMASIMSKTLDVAASGTTAIKPSQETPNDGVANGKTT